MSEKKRNLDRYSFQRKEDGNLVNPQVAGIAVQKKMVNKFVDE